MATEGLDLLPAGGAIVACARRGPFDHLNIVASLQRPAVAVAPRARTWPGRFVAARGCVPEAGPHLKAVLERGELLVMFPEGVMADDGAVHRGHPEIAALAVAARVPIVPAAWVSGTTRADARTRGRVLRLGEPLCFNRFWQDEIPSDALDGFILRAITDHVMAAITDLAGRPYADTYSDAVDDTPDVIERAEEARQRLAERRAAEQEWEAAEAELARELDERDQAELAEAAEAARLHAERAAAADERSRLRRRIALGLPPDEGEES
ncbi:1-acyl-sn-glycerol-3-phosphate acyltransferase [Brooklawnia cerclae]|uniref:1-acyl-sn-glycerol-3-phosphate acyltransferase n=1 Tax=Brooklawnia cerclae TaxID=349934 RepID=A0ABX0SHV0_9ACTN|nr:1-acyl-sn-glycerol-3-phosphate acyltransferase [Brooklawnia cerclae]